MPTRKSTRSVYTVNEYNTYHITSHFSAGDRGGRRSGRWRGTWCRRRRMIGKIDRQIQSIENEIRNFFTGQMNQYAVHPRDIRIDV
jgi:hypothetical protein